MYPKRIIVVGATSGIGRAVAELLLRQGCIVGLAGRREQLLDELAKAYPGRAFRQRIDVCGDDAEAGLAALIEKTGGMDVFLLCSGIGSQNPDLDPDVELRTVETNACGYVRMMDAAYRYFRNKGRGHIAAISSIAPAYSATKRFQGIYMQCLSQLSAIDGSKITFTDIRPGFVDTDLLRDGNYPMLMQPEKVARKIVKAIRRRKRVVIVDWRYRLLVAFWRLIPDALWERIPIGGK